MGPGCILGCADLSGVGNLPRLDRANLRGIERNYVDGFAIERHELNCVGRGIRIDMNDDSEVTAFQTLLREVHQEHNAFVLSDHFCSRFSGYAVTSLGAVLPLFTIQITRTSGVRRSGQCNGPSTAYMVP